MKRLRIALVCLLYLTLGSYAVPAMRVGSDDLSLPLAVVLAAALSLVIGIEYAAARRPLSAPRWVIWSVCAYATSIGLSWGTALELDAARSLKNLLFAFSTLPVLFAITDARLLRLAVISLGISSFAVFAYGAYGYFTESVGDPIQHSFGYFGVTYMESTRNSDVIYFQTAFWIFTSLGLFGRSRRLRWCALVLAGVIALGLAMSLARGTWISTSVTLAFVLWRAGRLRVRGVWQLLRVGTTALAVIWLLLWVAPLGSTRSAGDSPRLDDAIERLDARFGTLSSMSDSDAVSSNRVRFQLGIRSLELALAHPLGVGVGNAKFYLRDIGVSGLNHVENEYLQLLVEQSAVGLIAFVALVGFVLRRGFRLVHVSRVDSSAVWCGWALLAICTDWSLYALFNLLHESTWFWLVLGLAAAWVRTNTARLGPGDKTAPTPLTPALPSPLRGGGSYITARAPHV